MVLLLPSAIPDPYGMIINSFKGKIIGFMFEFYWEINCSTGEIELTDLTDQFKDAEIRCTRPDFAYDGKLIYFLQDTPGKIGVFDTENKELVYQYRFEEMYNRELMPLEIKYYNKNLYVLDSQKNLHVFETKFYH